MAETPSSLSDLLRIEVAWAEPGQQILISLEVPVGTTMAQALERSGLAQRLGIDPATHPMGVFGVRERSPQSRVLLSGERVELYRPLVADPKEARRRRARKRHVNAPGSHRPR